MDENRRLDRDHHARFQNVGRAAEDIHGLSPGRWKPRRKAITRGVDAVTIESSLGYHGLGGFVGHKRWDTVLDRGYHGVRRLVNGVVQHAQPRARRAEA